MHGGMKKIVLQNVMLCSLVDGFATFQRGNSCVHFQNISASKLSVPT